MKIFSITYDLVSPGQNYSKLAEAIKDVGTWWHYLDSTWLVATTLSANSIFERLKSALDSNDHILVVDIGSDHQGLLPKDAWEWINQHQHQRTPSYR